MPVPAEQLPTGTIIVKEIKTPAHAVGLYARVSWSDQRKDWEAQLGRLVPYADNHHHRLTIVQALSEVGSGRNGRRPKLIKLLANPKIQTMVVEHRDRLMRFGAEYVEAALTAQERKLLVMEGSEVNDDLVQDMIEVLTSFCARLYGSRSARHKAKKSTARHGALKHYDHQKQKANASRDTCGKQSDRRKIHIKLCAKKGARVPRALFRHVWGRKTYALAVAAIAFG